MSRKVGRRTTHHGYGVVVKGESFENALIAHHGQLYDSISDAKAGLGEGGETAERIFYVMSYPVSRRKKKKG